MAAKSTSSLRLDDFVNAVHADPANVEPTVLLAGYLGRSPEEGNVRVYLDPGLSNWLEVPEAEVIHSRPIADSPLGGSQLWIRASAQIRPGAAGAAAPAAEGGEDGEEKAAVGADTGVFNPMATIHPTIWTQFCPTGVGCIATIPCLPPSIGCPPGGQQGHGPIGQTGWHTCACPIGPTGWHTCACPATQIGCPNTVSCPPAAFAATPGPLTWAQCPTTTCAEAVGPTGTQGCTHVSPCVGQTGWHTCACPIGPTGTQGCGQGGLGAVGPTGTQGCTHISPCMGFTGWHTCACPIGPTGTQGCGSAEAVGYPTNPTAATHCFICPPPTLDPTSATRCFICPPIEAGGGFAAAAAQAGPIGPTGTQGCTQPPHCVGQTGWHTCACPPGYTGWQGCAGAGADVAQQSTAATLCTRVSPCVGHTGWQGCVGAGADVAQQSTAATLCTRVSPCVGHTGWQGCVGAGADVAQQSTAATLCTRVSPCVGHTGWHTCACPIGPTGTQGCTHICGAQQATAATVCTQVGCGGPVITLVTVSGCQNPHPSWVDACPTRLCGVTISGPCLPYTLGGCVPGGRQF